MSFGRFEWEKPFKNEEKYISAVKGMSELMDIFDHIDETLKSLSRTKLDDMSEITVQVDCLADDLVEIWLNFDPNSQKIPPITFKYWTQMIDNVVFTLCDNIFNEINVLQSGNVLNDMNTFVNNYITALQQSRAASIKNNGSVSRMQDFKVLLGKFCEIIDKIGDLSDLLSEEEQETLHFQQIVNSVSSLIPTKMFRNPSRLWVAQYKLFEDRLEQPERCAASKLINQLMDTSFSLDVFIQAFKSHPTLLKRPAAISELDQKISLARDTIEDKIDSIQEEIDRRSKEYRFENIVWAQQKKVAIDKYCGFVDVLSDSLKINTLKDKLTELKKQILYFSKMQIDNFEQSVYSSGTKEIKNNLKPPSSGNLSEFGEKTDGLIKVYYSDELYEFVQEVNKLSDLNITVPDNMNNAVASALPYFKKALVMQRCSMFYNTMGSRIISCQKPMLLNQARDFEKKAKQAAEPNPTPDVMSNIQKSLSEILNDNSTISSAHQQLLKKIESLFGIDLIYKKNEWENSLKEMREIVAGIKAKGFQNTERWTTFLDLQIYKALHYQVRSSLLSLSEGQAKIEVKLVFSENRVQLRPPIEEIRKMYYRSVSDLLTIPKKFRGIANDKTLFATICDQCSEEIAYVYEEGEANLKKIYDYQFKFFDWSVIAQNIEKLEERCETTISTLDQWKSNISYVTLRKETIKKIEQEGQLEIGNNKTFKVDITQALEGFERLLSQFHGVLIRALRKTLKNEFDSVEAFIDGGIELVTSTFESAEQIAECQRKFEELSRNKINTESIFASLTEKVSLLRNSGNETEKYDELRKKWNFLTDKMDNFNDSVAEQSENVKNKMIEDFKTLRQNVRNFKVKWDENKPKNLNMDEESVITTVPQALSKFKEEGLRYREQYQKLEKPLSDFKENVDLQDLDEFEKDLRQQEDAIELLIEWRSNFTEVAEQKWSIASAKLFLVEDFLNGWSQKLTQLAYVSDSALYIDEKVKYYKSVYPYLKFARGDDWADNHWSAFFKMVGLPADSTGKNLTLGEILDVGDMLRSNMKALKELSERARGEATISSSLEEIRSWFSTTNFSWFEHSFAGRTTYVVKEWKQLLSDLADKQSLIGSLKDSPFIKAFQTDVNHWDVKSVNLATSLKLLNEIQRRWLHLEPVFVKKALPSHQEDFEVVDTEFRNIMSSLNNSHRAASAADLNKESLEKSLQRLESLNRVLNEFLEQKRDKFSRFYFIGDEDLLEIIGQASEDATIIQIHLKKLFQGVHRVKFDDSNRVILSVISSMGEVVDLKHPITCEGPVEDWLMKLSNEISETLKILLIEMFKEKCDNIFKYPSQLTLLYHQIKFTKLWETKPYVADHRKYISKMLNQFVSQSCTSDLQRYIVRSLIIEYVRFQHVIDELERPGKWSWEKQLRFYIKQGKCFVCMGDAEIPYGYEYQGNPPRLVYTPLTAKCYLTLCEGISLGYGGNPYGPAGTGKTESVKALGQALGRQVLVFNCDESIDVQSMCRIFTGLVMGGAWGCFDEFNRLDEEVLSALSQQIQVIQTAILSRASSVELLGRNVPVNSDAGIYVTLNPAGKGYGGRSKLPSNLTQLFRAVAMSAPDNELIAEVLMYSQGFHSAAEVSKQLVLVFQLCKQLLSPEIHYDWGLRSLKSVLVTAEQWLNNMEGEIDEAALIVKALRVSTLSKLTFADRVAFEQIIQDVFPSVKIDKVEMFELREAASKTIKEMNIVELPHQVDKMLQMWESINQRTGVVLTGPSGCGKTTLWTLLQKSLEKIGVKVDIEVMNPKSMPRKRLLGRVDYDTREWFDGVLTRAARRAVASNDRTWIVCDGDIDPEWIESLNSVLDDNRLLTLPNGERIQFDYRVNFVFESHSLEHASPATVSRMAVILLAPEDLTVENVCQSWLSKWPSESRVPSLFKQLFYETINLVLSKQQMFSIGSTTFGITQTVLSHLDLITDDNESSFLNALIRGAVAILPPDEQLKLAQEIYKLSKKVGLMCSGIDPNNLLDQYWNGSSLQLFDFHPSPAVLPPIEASSLPLVSTTEVQRTIHTIKPWIESGQPMMLIGPRGSGKTTILSHLFKIIPTTTIIVINCSAKTDAQSLMSKLMQQCIIASTASGQVLRPRSTEKALVFFRNFDLPRPDKWGTVQLVSFMQQILTHGGFYNEELQWIKIERIQFVFSMSSAEKRPMSTRFTSIIRIATMHDTNQSQLQSIYSHYLQVILEKTPYNEISRIQSIASAIVKVYLAFSKKYSVDEQPHYDFTYRDITRWVVQLQRYIHNSNTFTPSVIVNEGIKHFADRISIVSDKQKSIKDIISTFRDAFSGIDDQQNIEYCNYQIETNDKAPIYLVQMEKSVAQEAFKKLIVSYEREMGSLNIFRTPDTEFLSHRISAALAIPASNIVAITLPGLSFVEILKVICHSSGIEIHSPPLIADFSYHSFMLFLKDLIPKIASKDDEAVLLMEDFMFVDDAVLDALNSLMASGEVSGLFSQTEFDSLCSSLQAELRDSDSGLTLQEFFCEKVKRLLHVVVLLNPTHSSYRSYFSFAPSFVSDSILIWATELSNISLQSIPIQILTDAENEFLTSDTINKLAPLFSSAFSSVQEPPIKYVDFLNLYVQLYSKKQKTLTEKKHHLDIGLGKLNDAAKTVDTLSGEIQAKKVALSAKEKEANDAMEQIKKSVASCSKKQSEIQKMQAEIGEQEKKLHAEQKQIDDQLGTIQPQIDAALDAVGKIKRNQIAEVRTLSNPKDSIIHVMSGVLMMLGEDNLTWPSIRKVMGSEGFTGRILKFDAKQLTNDIIKNVQRHLAAYKESFEDSVIRSASQAVAPLAQWVKANIAFFSVLERVEPLRIKSDQLTKEINNSKAQIERLTLEKETVDKQVEDNQERFKVMTKEAEQLKNEVKQAEQSLKDAEDLFSKLKDERGRWDVQRGQIMASLNKLSKEVMLAAAFAAFCGKFPEDERKRLMSIWLPILHLPSDAQFSMPHFLFTESELLTLRGPLSGDALSIENAVIITNSFSVPLIIDPTAQSLDWLYNYFNSRNIQAKILPRSHERFTSELTTAVKFGKVLIISEIDSIDGVLIPLIRKDLIFSGSRPAIRVGDREVVYHEDFKLFLVTREPQPQIHLTAASHVSIVNFSVTRSGLESTLLSVTLEKEQPEVQSERSKYIKQEEEMKTNLSNLEINLLKTLVESDGSDILNNTELIRTLNETKTQAAKVAESLEKIEALSKKLEEKANVYKSLASLGASLYFAISSLNKIDHMYRFSSSLFMNLFSSIFNSGDSQVSGQRRTMKFEESLISVIFRHVANSMFNKHRTAGALHLIHSCYSSMIDQSQWNFLLSEAVSSGDAPAWVPQDRRPAFNGLAKAMPDLVQSLKMRDNNYTKLWGDWVSKSKPEESMPQIDGQPLIKRGITPFTQLILISVFCPHRLVPAIQTFVAEALGLKGFSSSFDFDRIATDETGLPFIFIVSPGADPSAEIRQIAKNHNKKLIEIAVGQESADVTIGKLHNCAKDGTWFMLKNTHLSISLVSRLEKEYASLTEKKDGFKVFFTTESHNSFPPLLLANSIKVAVEAPPGIKANLYRSLEMMDKDKLQPNQFVLATSVAYFHAIIQERRTYIPQGWTKFYEFSMADLACALQIIRKGNYETPEHYEYIRGLLCYAVYGGRVDNSFDFKVLSLYLNEFLDGTKNPLHVSKQTKPSDIKNEDLLSRIPDKDDPFTFFLPPNATKTVALSQMKETIICLRKLAVVSADDGLITKQMWIEKLTPVAQHWNDLLHKHPRMTDQRQKSPIDETLMASALYSQSCVIHGLVNTLQQFFTELDGFLHKGGSLSHYVQSIGKVLISGEVPDSWMDIAEGPVVPNEWLNEVVRKVETIDTLAAEPALVKKGIQLGAILRPTALLDALRQQTARETGVRIVDLKLVTSFKGDIDRAIYVTDLDLQGAVFQGHKIAPMSKDGPITENSPKVAIYWEVRKDETGFVDIPLYSSATRERFIVCLPTPYTENSISMSPDATFAFAGTAFIVRTV